jgi:RNA polymerase sigma-70 factor, ECF subfamily
MIAITVDAPWVAPLAWPWPAGNGRGEEGSCRLRPGWLSRLCRKAWAAAPGSATVDLERLSDEELIAEARRRSGEDAAACLEVLYGRFYPRVAAWCLRLAPSREEAGDLAQEVFLRVHSRLDTFRGESRFSTWLYQVARSVAINRGQAAERARRRTAPLGEPGDAGTVPELADPLPDAEDLALKAEDVARLRTALAEDLEPLEARVLVLHFAHGMTLPRITEMLALDNRSGAKAYVVSAMRKLRRRFGRGAARPAVAAAKELP